MSQNREAPAYQEYAASMLAKIEYRTMTLAERGLLDTMRRECWVNGRLPERPGLLAKVLGFSEQEITDCLPAVMPLFRTSEGAIFCPELDNYRRHLEERKEKLSRSGKAGADITNKRKKDAKSRTSNSSTATPSATPSATPAGVTRQPRRGQVGVLVKSSTAQHSQNQSLGKEVIPDPDLDAWREEYDRAEAAETKRTRVTV